MPQDTPFADLHCHPAELIYHRLREDQSQDEFLEGEDNHPLNYKVIKDNCLKLLLGKMAGPYLQSNFHKCAVARHSLVFAALYPLEMGFTQGRFRGGSFLASMLSSIPFLNAIVVYLNIKTLNISNKRFRYMRRGQYDYYNELETMYQYYRKRDDSIFKEEVNVDCDGDQKVVGSYTLIKNRHHRDELIYPVEEDQSGSQRSTTPPSRIGVLLTIEGMHAFGTGHVNRSEPFNVDWPVLRDRLITWKKLEHPIFFVTFAHHFQNSLCGHAHSFPRVVGALLLNQDKGLADEFTNDGYRAASLLLNLGEFAQLDVGRRILIDVKHMSPRSRRQYYNLISAHNDAHPSDRIPIVASHMGYAGRERLEQITHGVGKATRKAEKDRACEAGFTIDGTVYEFNPWGINLCSEDVIEIVRSRGLIGISMDERVTSARRTRKVVKRKFTNVNSRKRLYQNIVLNNLLGCIHAVYNSSLPDDEKSWIWSGLCLGSDFDGYINPLDTYAAVSFYHQLADDLKKAISQFSRSNGPLAIFNRFKEIDSTSDEFVDEFVEKFMFRNAYEFALDHIQEIDHEPLVV